MMSNMFSGLAFYEEEKREIADRICDEYNAGNYSFTMDISSKFTESDKEDILKMAENKFYYGHY